MFEAFEHTADVGLRVRAATLDELFSEAGRGLFSLIVDNLGDVRPQTTLTFDLAADRLDDLFFDWLNELLYTFESRRLLLSHFEVHVTDTTLHAAASGEPLDHARHILGNEIKAITYHNLTVQPVPDGWLAEVILDI